jgi:hypothetical protein
MDFQEVGCGGMDWTGLGWLRIETGGEQLLSDRTFRDLIYVLK